jgi:hypothetical protein
LLAPPQTLTLTDAELAEGLQYGPTAGLPALRAWVEGLQALEHGRSAGKAEGWRVSVGIGAQDLIYKVSLCIRSASAIVIRVLISLVLVF